jgi:hypothetical protein
MADFADQCNGGAASRRRTRNLQAITQRDDEPLQRVEELVAVVGRRGGKSRAISTLAAYIAGLCEHPALVRGERGVLLIIAPDQRQATICLDYCTAAFEDSPILKQLVDQRTRDTLRLTNNIDIEVRASDFRRLRGPTFIAVIADECAFHYGDGSSNPDDEILSSIRPGLGTTNGPLILISSPYARRGELWRTYQQHFGSDGDPLILVAQGASRTFNPSLPQRVVDRALARDQASASAEYLAQFRSDLESFVDRLVVQSCVVGFAEHAPQAGVRYFAFCDPSGGSQDSMTLAIGHQDRKRQMVVVDCIREIRPPFSPEATCENFAKVLQNYRVYNLIGDRYADVWPVEQFQRFNIKFEQAAQPKSELYQSLLPLLNSRRIELLDNQRLIDQIVGLERRVVRRPGQCRPSSRRS